MLRRRAPILFLLSRRNFYDSRTRNDTIFAPATTISSSNNNNKGSPLSVIRVSGPKTASILNSIINAGHNAQISLPKARYASLKKILEPNSGELIDLGLVIWFPKPHSYTGEDVCEFHLHGSQAIMTKMLTTLGSFPGVRPAEPGEFTRRAVISGKMSLMEAESLLDLIKSSTDNQRRLALNGLDGSTRQKYNEWTQQLVRILAHLEASIDFGEDELLGERAVVSDCIGKLVCLADTIGVYIKSSALRRDLINDGVSIAILGKPNAGKSTFMNLLCKRDLSIVSDLSGTTRDLVRHSIELAGHSVTLCDTAGLKSIDQEAAQPEQAEDLTRALIDRHHSIEQEGIRRAFGAAKSADILIYLIDGSSLGSSSDKIDEIYKEISVTLDVVRDKDPNFTRPKFVHLVINKLDLNVYVGSSNYVTQLGKKMKTKLELEHSICMDISVISCKTQENFDRFMRSLTDRLDKMCSANKSDTNDCGHIGPVQLDYVNERHLSLLKSMHRHLELASGMDLNTIDKMAQHLRESIDYLSRIVGSISSDDVIDVIFRDFCIGK